ncbi:hypothetical protein GP486_004848, partial [Trichoglossum hirsutum]
FTKWLCKNFGKIGKIIVLRSILKIKLDERFLSFEADLVRANGGNVAGHLSSDADIGSVQVNGAVTVTAGDHLTNISWYGKYGTTNVMTKDIKLRTVNESSPPVLSKEEQPVGYGDGSDII